MMQGISRIAANEMSHDEFIETYGSCSPSPTLRAPAMLMPLAPAVDLSNEDGFLDDERASSDVERVTSRRHRYSKTMKHHATREPLRATRPHGSQYLSMSQEDILSSVEASPGPTSSASSSSSTSSRRTTKFQNIANRLARRSFRVGAKKKTVEGPSHSEPLSARPPTPNRLGAFLFKRSKSVSRQQPAECTSFRVLSDDEQLSSVRPVASTPSRPQSRVDRRSRVTRSMSMSPSTSLLVKPKNLQPSKRHSAYAPNDWETLSDGKQQQQDTICDGAEMGQGQGGKEDILQQILEQKQQILDEQRRFRDEVNPSRVRQVDSGSELDVARKYESIRQNEETRVVAIVALLNRRKNSLRIKCDRFEKELQASSPTGNTGSNSNSKEVSNTAADRLRFVKERARAFRRKLTVVEQCIDEQKDKMQLSAAKLELKCCVELFQMGLANDEAVLAERGALARRHTGPAKTSSRPTLKASSSCDTLGSVDDTSVFEDSTPVSDFSLGFERSSPSQHLTSRTSSATQGQVSPASVKSNLTLNDSCDKGAMRRSGRCRSIDYAITSDCDSGFDNGDTLSRSDISLDGTMSKSTGSIVSSCSQSGCQATTTCSISSSNGASPMSKHNDVFYSPRQAAKTLDTIPDSCFESHDDVTSGLITSRGGAEVDRRVLAQIEDFEHFAEKRIRCLSNKGKIVPLKGGS